MRPAPIPPWRTADFWEALADRLRRLLAAGFGSLMTEDTVRFAAIEALAAAGVDVSGMRVEWPHPRIGGSRLDLVLGGTPPQAVFGFTFPKEPNAKYAAWTMTLGEILKDFSRLARVPGDLQRLLVYVESDTLHKYMAGAGRRYGMVLDRSEITLTAAAARELPGTAARIVGAGLAAHPVTAQRIYVTEVDTSLRLAVYDVEAVDIDLTTG